MHVILAHGVAVYLLHGFMGVYFTCCSPFSRTALSEEEYRFEGT
jgi:hypothetical protein